MNSGHASKILLVGVCVALTLSSCDSADNADTTITGSPPTSDVATTVTTQTVATTTTTPTTQPPPSTTTTVRPKVSVERVRSLPYREASGDDEVSTVDVFVPEGPDGRPAVALLHGVDADSDGTLETPLDLFAVELARLGATVFYFDWDTSSGPVGWSSRSADDLSCVGSFIAAHAAEYGADPDKVVIVGHSMGGPAGSNLAFRSFAIDADADCVATSPSPRAAAFVGIGGAYGGLALPVESELGSFLAFHISCNTPPREVTASEEVAPGLTAEQGYELDGYSSAELAEGDLRVVLVIGTLDPWRCTGPESTRAFADALSAAGIDAQVVELEGGGHEDVVQPYTLAGSLTLEVLSELFDDLGT